MIKSELVGKSGMSLFQALVLRHVTFFVELLRVLLSHFLTVPILAGGATLIFDTELVSVNGKPSTGSEDQGLEDDEFEDEL